MKKQYRVTSVSGYNETTWTNKRLAIRHARNTADATNGISSVYDGDVMIAQYRYTPEMGGKTYRAEIEEG